MQKIKVNQLDILVIKNSANCTIDTAPGFSFQSTPGHGYVRTNKQLTNRIPSNMRSTKFSSPGKYEEDCDWSIPVVVHRDLFTEKIQLAALTTLYHWHPDHFMQLFKMQPVESKKLKEIKRQALTKNMFIPRTGYGSWHKAVPKGKVGCDAIRKSDGKEISVLIPKQEYEAAREHGFKEKTYPVWDKEQQPEPIPA